MLEITFKNGDYKCWKSDEFTDYRYFGEVFVVIKNACWVGIYSMSEIRAIEFAGGSNESTL